MSKTVAGSANPTRLTPGGRRRRLSRGPPRPCQPDFSVFFENLGNLPKTPKTVDTQTRTQIRKPKETNVSTKSAAQRPSPGRRLSRGPPLHSQPGFFSSFSRAPEEPENLRKTDRPSVSSPPANPSDPRDLSSPPRRRPVRGGGCLGPSPEGVNSPHDASMNFAHGTSRNRTSQSLAPAPDTLWKALPRH